VTEGSNLLVDLSQLGGLGSGGLGTDVGNGLLALVESLGLDLALLLEVGNNIVVLPADLVRDTLDGAVLAAGLELEDAKGRGDDHALHAIVRWGDTLKELDAVQGSGSTGSLVGDHTTDSTVEDAGGSAEMEGTTSGVDDATLAEESVVLHWIRCKKETPVLG